MINYDIYTKIDPLSKFISFANSNDFKTIRKHIRTYPEEINGFNTKVFNENINVPDYKFMKRGGEIGLYKARGDITLSIRENMRVASSLPYSKPKVVTYPIDDTVSTSEYWTQLNNSSISNELIPWDEYKSEHIAHGEKGTYFIVVIDNGIINDKMSNDLLTPKQNNNYSSINNEQIITEPKEKVIVVSDSINDHDATKNVLDSNIAVDISSLNNRFIDNN